MSQSISERLHKWCIKVVYWNSLVLGLLPAPYNWNTLSFWHSKSYLYYSFLIQCIILTISPLSTTLFASPDEKERSFMRGHMLLLLTYYIGRFFRVLANIVLCIEIRLKRQQILDLYKRYRMFKLGYKEQLNQFSNVKNEIRIDIRRAQDSMVLKLLTGHINIATITTMFIVMQRLPGRWYIIMVSINFVQAQLLTAANMVLFIVLSQMHLHFTYINKSLEAMLMEKTPQKIINSCWRLYGMHFECYQLSLKILNLCRTVTFFTLVKIFFTNITMLYHAVLFSIGSIAVNRQDIMLGSLSVAVFYCDTVLITIAISNLQVSCNRTGAILGYFGEKEQEYGSKEFIRMLNEFHHYLAGHKLNFSIFGMFNLNKNTILQYFISALVHLIVLVQFDMKLRASQ